MTQRAHEPASAPKPITSLQNEKVKAIRALEMRKVRKETGLFVAEGASILITAREHGFAPETLVFQAGTAPSGVARGLVDWALGAGAECLEVNEAVLGKLASKDNPQNMLAVFRQRWRAARDAAKAVSADLWLVLEEVRDSGNLGTIIRTVDAVGASGVILIGHCCDPYARECVRATMGSVFAVPLVKMTREAFLSWRAAWKGEIIGTHLDGHEDFRKVQPGGPVLLLMGSEGPGLSDELARTCTHLIKIPMAGQLDSLNLAVAAGLVLYQLRGPNLAL